MNRTGVEGRPSEVTKTPVPLVHPPRCFPFGRGQERTTVSKVNEVVIYYGTMFGNAERYARSLQHEIMKQRQLVVHVYDLDAFVPAAFTDQKQLTPLRLFVFVVSTHFAGAPSPSAERFHKWIESLDSRVVHHSDSMINPPTEDPHTRGQRHDRNHPFPLPVHPFKGMHYAVFGIGDSIYLTYNAMAKFVDSKIKQFGATRFLPLGLGDCSNGLHATYLTWEAQVLHKLPRRKSTLVRTGISFLSSRFRSVRVASIGAQDTGQRLFTNKKLQSVHETSVLASTHSQHGDRACSGTLLPTVCDNFARHVQLFFQCRVLDGDENVSLPTPQEVSKPGSKTHPRTPRVALFDDKPFAEITPVQAVGASWSTSPERQSGVFRVRFLQPDTTYTTVSTLAIFPYNSHRLVTEIAEAFGYDLDAIFELKVDATPGGTNRVANSRHQLPFPTPCSVRTALTEFLELRTVTREFIRVASGFVVTTDERDFLESLARTDGSTAFNTRIHDQHKGILDLVALAPSLQIPLDVFMNITPTIKPRYYTIASSSLVSRSEVDIAVALGNPTAPRGLGATFFAQVLASWEHTLRPLSVRGFISASRFQFHDDGVSPMIFIATGVGFTAIRAIIQERLAKWYQNPPSTTIPKHILFLGVINEDSIIFDKDLRRWEQQMLVKVHYAYSNDRRHPRQHVQEIVESRLDEVFETITSSYGSRILACGRSAMVRSIRDLFQADQLRRRSRWYDTLHASGRFIDESFE